MRKKKKLSHPYYTGWAMEAYPEMSEADFAHHIERQVSQGANFLWIGHNNPGEVDKEKNEPALSYAVYEAYVDPKDRRHNDALAIIEAQHRLLRVCQRLGVPVVFPVGYQIQMGERWNKKYPEHLRRFYNGKIINWGGISATFLSPQYQEDISRFYQWTIKNFILPYKEVIKLINLADEPFGGDYSHWAKRDFHHRYGMTFAEAFKLGKEGCTAVGEYQSRYIVEYARWSAECWHALYPHIPTTMSFCGYHGREENHLPDIVALFSDTPEYFQPTFDVYPRDGSPQTPITESDITMLIIFLRQLSYLSSFFKKPYWLWTTGNSWGLGQDSPDKAYISDALANQFLAVATAVANGGDLRGVAVWNYNVKRQGLYNDIYNTTYKPEEMFVKLTRFLAWLRRFLGQPKLRQAAEFALILPRGFGYRKIGETKKCVWATGYGLNNMHSLAKQANNFIVLASLNEVVEYDAINPDTLKAIIFPGDDEEIISGDSRQNFINYLAEKAKRNRVPELFLPKKIMRQLGLRKEKKILPHLRVLSQPPEEIKADFWQKELDSLLQLPRTNSMYLTNLPLCKRGNKCIRMIYNLRQKEQKLFLNGRSDKWFYLMDLSGNLQKRIKVNKPTEIGSIKLRHHSIGFFVSGLGRL